MYTTTTKNSSLHRAFLMSSIISCEKHWKTNLSTYTQSRHFSKHFSITGKRQ